MSNIQITGRHVEITNALHEYVEKKLEKMERHFDHVTQVHVILSVEKTDHKAEATVHASGHADLFAEAKAENMYAAIESLSEKLTRQITKHKEKIQHTE
ncbi:MAG: ribosome-associated translation inhibitor RaiA [Gammaproteobacteria bacterium]|nr:ribosome-associated translation inhibitor RaiA [Gammaproteobacteria bacterium]